MLAMVEEERPVVHTIRKRQRKKDRTHA